MLGYIKKVRCVDCLNLSTETSNYLKDFAKQTIDAGGAIRARTTSNIFCERVNKQFPIDRISQKERCFGFASKRFKDFYNSSMDLIQLFFSFKSDNLFQFLLVL